MANKAKKAGTDLSLSKRSRALKSAHIISTPKTENKSKVDPSNGSSKYRSRRNISPINTKPATDPSTVLSPLSSICSSPARSLRSATSTTRSSIRKINGSGLRMPSPKIGFFDKKQPPIVRGNTSKVRQAHKEISKNITSIEKKSMKEDTRVRNQPIYSKRRQLSVKKSLDWDNAFFTNEGLLNTEEMCVINRGFTKAYSNQESFGSRKDVPSHVQSESVDSRRLSILRKSVDWDTAFPGEGLLNPEELFKVNKGFKKAKSSQYSTKSQDATRSPLNYQCLTRHPACHNSKEIKFTSQDATRSSTRNVMPSGLRMPSPRIGFFDD